MKMKRLTNDEALAIYERLTKGDKSARNELIEKSIPLVEMHVESLVTDFPRLRYLKEDMESEGFLAVTKAVDFLQHNEPISEGTVNGYLRSSIQFALSKFQQDFPSSMPHTSQERARAKDAEFKPPTIFNQSNCHDFDSLMNVPREHSDFAVIDLLDQIDACCESELEKTVVKMRCAGSTDKEIGEAVGFSRPKISKLRKRLYARFLERSGMKGEA